MKLFALTSAIFLLSAVESLEPETIISNYIQFNAEMRDLLRNVSFDLNFVDMQINELILNLERNISDLRVRYESSKFVNYQNEFSSKCVELSADLKSNADCSRYVHDIMEQHNHYQNILSSSIKNALVYWIEKHNDLNVFIIAERSGLSHAEKDAHDCSERSNGLEESCAKKIYNETLRFEESNVQAIESRFNGLIKGTDEVLEKLYADLKEVFNFYEKEEWIHDRLIKNNPKSPESITEGI